VGPTSESRTSRSNSTTVIASSWQLLLGMGILMLGAGLQSTEISLRATLEGFTPAVTGIVMSCYYLGYLAGTSAAPYLVRRVGHIRVFAAMAAIASATILLQAIFVQPLSWALLRGISGLCFAAIYVVAESWLNDRSSRATRGTLLAIYMVVLYIGLGGAQFLLIPADPRTTTPFMLAAVMISLAMVPIVLAAHRAPEIALPRKVSYRELYRDSPLGVVGVTVAGMVTSSVYSMGPVYAQRSGLATTGVATFMGISILAAVIGQYPIGRLSDRVDRRTIMAWVSSVASGSAVLLVVFLRMPRLIFFPLTALFSSMAFTLYSLSVSHVNDQLEPQQMVAASGALLRLNGLGAAVSPVLLGALIGQFGPPAYFGTLAALTLGLTVFDLWRKRHSEPVPADLKGTFIAAGPQGAATQIAAGSLTPQHTEASGAPNAESRSSRGAPPPQSPSR
jgi:MFS family permease